jgi:demethylmenaquinone methyltransferase/2-methoxy-6-polyprenyl-1,4-benzoquinol methylase
MTADLWSERAERYRAATEHASGDDLALLVEWCAAGPGRKVLDVATGGGHTARALREAGCVVVTVDSAPGMLPDVVSRAEALPFADDSFERVVSGHFYGHLDAAQRAAFLGEARRIAPELVLVDASRAHSEVDEDWSERLLSDGSRWEVFKRWFEPEALLAEMGGKGDVLHAGDWFVVVRSPR